MKKNDKALSFEDKEIEEQDEESNWSIKRITAGIVVFISLLGFGALQYSDNFKKIEESPRTGILGAFSKDHNTNQPEQKIPKDLENIKNLEVPSKEKVQEIILQAKETVSEITPENAASSSQELQKLINDLQAIQNKSKEPKDIACELICGGKK